ncbi:MAG: ECF transporter S component [Sarcina sp.]
MSGKKNLKITLIGFAIALNIIGTFIAFNIKAIVYLDSIGTVLISILFGPIIGAVTGIISSIISGITFDIYSIYYIPVQIFTGIMIGYFARGRKFDGIKKFLYLFIVAIIISSIGAVITIQVFDGLTSSGSSYILMFLRNIGINDFFAAFIVQIITDYFDELIGVFISYEIIKRLPFNIKNKLKNLNNNI